MNAPGHSTQPIPPRGPNDCCDTREACFIIRELAINYGTHQALRDVSLEIHRGCITAIVGPSGCGKSTFLAALNRMSDMLPECETRGTIQYGDQQIHAKRIDLIQLRRRVGMIFQKPNPFPLSIRKNLTFPLKQHGLNKSADREAAMQSALEQVGLWNEVKDRLDRPALALSGGQQQRLCIARALALKPEVLLFDEPCSALDPIASGVVEDLIVSLRGDYTQIVVTHNLAQARRIADDVALFWVQDGCGQLIESGPAAEFFQTPRHELTAAYIAGARG